MKAVILTMVLFFSFSSFASDGLLIDSDLVGMWCEDHDDFIDIMNIEANGDLELWVVGASSYENHGYAKGFISQGAGRVFMDVEGENEGLISYKVSKRFFKRKNNLKRKKKLTFEFESRRTAVYKECNWKVRR